jgi:FMN phosphatase YigB (HAD superfamily)
MVVMFDIDGVLADFYAGYRALQTSLGKTPTTSTRWDDYWDPDVWRAIKTSPTFWQYLPRLAGVDFERINRLQAEATVYFCTSRPGTHVARQTKAWLVASGIQTPSLIVSDKKGEVAKGINADYSLEDKAGNALYIAYHARGCKSYLLDGDGTRMDRCYNRFDHSVLGRSVVRVATVEAFLEEIENAIN